jgi:hypothetical protein
MPYKFRRSFVIPSRNIALTAFLALAGLAAMPAATQDPAPAAQESAAAPAAELAYSNKWRLEVSEGANNEGVMHFRITPKGGAAIDVPVALKKGRGEDGCARDIRDTFKKTLDKNLFKIELDDGEDVLVKVRKGPDVAIQLVESTVKGTRVNLDRE